MTCPELSEMIILPLPLSPAPLIKYFHRRPPDQPPGTDTHTWIASEISDWAPAISSTLTEAE